MDSKRNLFTSFLFLIVIFFSATTVFANVGPPPAILWLKFDTQNTREVELQGVQIIGCHTAACIEPVLLQQLGVCTNPNCLSGTPIYDEGIYTLDCTQTQCRAESSLYRDGGEKGEANYLKLIVQFSDKTRQSESFKNPFLKDYNWNNNLLVKVDEATLEVTKNTEPVPSMYKLPSQYLLAFALTLLIELVVAAIFFTARFKYSFSVLIKKLLTILVINSITFPIVWFFFPAWQPFIDSSSKIFGIAVLLASSAYALLWYFVFRAVSLTSKINWGAAIILFLFLMIFACFELVMWLAYQHYPVASARGLSYPVMIAFAEIFAVVAEAVLLNLYGRLPLKLASWLSLLMNLVSFFAGLIVFHEWYF